MDTSIGDSEYIYMLEQNLLYIILSDFVHKTTDDRPDTHGHHHMSKVVYNSFEIAKKEGFTEDLDMLMTVAFLHDVADHKYDKDGELKKQVVEFLHTLYKDPIRVQLIVDIIDRISYSREATAIKLRDTLDYDKVLGKLGCTIRQMVSDADKLEAIGEQGLDRCIKYGFEIHGYDSSDEVIVGHVRRHAGEKLLLLKDMFIRTKAGKQMAEPLHRELQEGMLHLEEMVARVRLQDSGGSELDLL